MGNQEAEPLGPIDYIVVEFPAGHADFTGEMAEALQDLVERGVVRILDLVMVKKEADGSVEGFEIADLGDEAVGHLRTFEADVASLLAEEDVEAIAEALEPGSVAGVLVWENTWAVPFASAARRSGGQLVAGGRIPLQALLALVEADNAAASEGA